MLSEGGSALQRSARATYTGGGACTNAASISDPLRCRLEACPLAERCAGKPEGSGPSAGAVCSSWRLRSPLAARGELCWCGFSPPCFLLRLPPEHAANRRRYYAVRHGVLSCETWIPLPFARRSRHPAAVMRRCLGIPSDRPLVVWAKLPAAANHADNILQSVASCCQSGHAHRLTTSTEWPRRRHLSRRRAAGQLPRRRQHYRGLALHLVQHF